MIKSKRDKTKARRQLDQPASNDADVADVADVTDETDNNYIEHSLGLSVVDQRSLETAPDFASDDITTRIIFTPEGPMS